MLDKAAKDKIIKKFQTHDGDTGSPQVQIAILTEEIHELVEHLKSHKKDFSSRRGLLKKVSERRRLLRYIERENMQAFEDITKRLKIKMKSIVKADEEDVVVPPPAAMAK
ncbi:30S ribosomal protein S15 [Candidatus Uhrbacteria bacterium]|nr:30S ribosomal protein S15 [Candidatus Uhrbacteria bacterium]